MSLQSPALQITQLHSQSVSLDPDHILPEDTRALFSSLLTEFEEVFDPDYKGYNGASGPFEAVVNMGPVQPPQRKGRLPHYARGKLLELQQKFDELEEKGVFARPEDIGITVEYLNPSFLVKKPNGGFRLVTAFADVRRYSKPQPSLMPDVNSTLRQIAQWKHHCNRPHQCLLLNSPLQCLHEILRGCHSLPRHMCLHQIGYGHTRL